MGGESKKRKKSYYIKCAKKPKKSKELKNRSRGFLVSCNHGNKFSNQVRTEAYAILNEYADIKFGPEKLTSDDIVSDEDETNLEDALTKEVMEIKSSNQKNAERRFQFIPTKVKSFLFIETSLDDPAELVDDIYLDLLMKKERKTKFCQKFLPVSFTCHASQEDIVETCKTLINPIFVDSANLKPINYCLAWKVTSNTSLNRDSIFEEVNLSINSVTEHCPEYKNPDIVINIQVVANTCFISILRNYVKFKKYNIDLIQENQITPENTSAENVSTEMGDKGMKTSNDSEITEKANEEELSKTAEENVQSSK